jgi:lysophospholipase L1-like esterase
LSTRLLAVAAALACAASAGTGLPAGAAGGAGHWVASWASSPSDSSAPIDGTGLPAPTVLVAQTLRMVVTPHLGGRSVRVHLSNRFGSAPVTFGAVTVGRYGSAVSDLRPVTFHGSRTVTVAAGQDAVSDPAPLSFPAFAPLAVSMFLPNLTTQPTKHWNAVATSYYSAPGTGDLTGAASNSQFSLITRSWLYVDGLDVQAPTTTGAVVAFGDSITEGFVGSNAASVPSDPSVADHNGRYPDDLQRRLSAAGIPLSMVNAGIGSNMLLKDGQSLQGVSGLHRFRQDALEVPGVRAVIVLEGINDLGIPPSTVTAEQLIAGYRQLIAMAHAAGKRIWLATLLPASNALLHGTLSPNCEPAREAVNAWIRAQRLADGVIDFDKAMRDPANPTTIRPAYVGPDNLHPNLAGYQVMADAVPLDLLRTVVP